MRLKALAEICTMHSFALLKQRGKEGGVDPSGTALPTAASSSSPRRGSPAATHLGGGPRLGRLSRLDGETGLGEWEYTDFRYSSRSYLNFGRTTATFGRKIMDFVETLEKFTKHLRKKIRNILNTCVQLLNLELCESVSNL